MDLPEVIAHRGASADAPENTLAAAALAIEHGASWIEIDVNISKNGTLFIHHDDTLDRCTTGSGYLVGTSDETLATLDAGSWFSTDFGEEPLPTLSQLVKLLKPHGTGVNLEIKATPGTDVELAAKVCDFLESHWPRELPVLASSFSPLVLEEFRRRLPEQPLGLLVCAVPGNWLEWMQRYKCNTLHCAEHFATPELCQTAESAGYPVLCYTVNDARRAEVLFDMGVSSIFTDHAKQLLTALQS